MRETDAATPTGARPISAALGQSAAPPSSPAPPDPPDTPPSVPRLRSLRTQMALVFGGLAIGIALTLSLIFSELLKNRMEQEAAAALQVVSSTAARQLADQLFDNSRLVQVLASSPDLWHNGLNSAEAQALFARMRITRPYSTWFGVADPQGVVAHATGDMLLGRNMADAAWFTAGSHGPYISGVVPAKLLAPLLPTSSTGEPLRFVDFSAPIKVNGQVIGVLAMHTNWDWARETLQELIPAFAAKRQLSLFVFDRSGTLIYAPDGKLAPFLAVDQRLPLRPDQMQTDRQTPSVHARVVQWNDQTAGFLTSVSPLPARDAPSDLGWYVVARQPATTAYADAQLLTLGVIAMGLAAAVLTACLVWVLSRRMARELNTLAQAAWRIESGEHETPLPLLRSSREAHQLSQSFRSMTHRLLAAHESMEHEIQMRTHELHEANRELDRQASTDPLTGLLNRRGFDAQVQFAMALARRSGRPLCLMTLDIDHFKQVNDNYGHEVGDLVLKSIANQIRGRLRDSDVIARFGGEEFVVLLPDTPAEAGQRIARELLAGIENHRWPLVGTLTLSAGVTALRPTLQNGTEDTDTALLRRSDEALYQSKNAGRNQVHFQP